MRSEVAVIGAGTAGLLTARRLAELGVATTVYDQKKKPGFPVNASGILSIGGLNSLKIDYRKAITNELKGTILHVGGEKMRVVSENPIAYVLDRLKLNELCMEGCEKAGVNVKTGSKIDNHALDQFSRDRIIVGADGVVSTVARHFGFPPIEKHILTYREEYNYNLFEDNSLVELFFDNKILPGFFGWICPNAKNMAEIGVGIDSKHGNSKAAFDRFVRIERIKDIIEEGRLIASGASMIPLALRKHFVDEKREILLVGDAAGQVKPTTGGGVIFGGNGAMLAAEVISRHIRGGAKLRDYEKGWRKEFQKEISLHSLFYRMYSSMSRRQLERVIRIARVTGFENFLGKYGDMDRPSRMIKRFFFRGLAR